MRRSTLRGHDNILKRLLIHVGAFNVSLILRKMLGAGTPRELKNRAARLVLRLFEWLTCNDLPVGAATYSNALKQASFIAHKVGRQSGHKFRGQLPEVPVFRPSEANLFVNTCRFDRHRGSGCPLTPATPPCERVRTRRFEKLRLHSPTNEGRPSDLK